MELQPANFAAPVILGELYKLTGRPQEAVRLLASSPMFANSAVLASAYVAAGRRHEALAILDTVEKKPRPGDVLAIAMAHLNLGDADRGFQWLERGVATRLGYMRFLGVHPMYDKWRADPRFVALVRQLRLPTPIG